MKYKWTILCVIVGLATTILNVYFEFSNPDMTRARLWMEYWPYFTVEVILLVPLSILMKKELK